MLTREQLTADQWEAVRDTPHHVIVAVSVAGGSAFDEMLERAAGLRGIVEARDSAHPLLSEIAGAQHIMHAQNGIRRWYYTLQEPERTPRNLQDKALETARNALDALGTHGTADDLLHYGQFVLSLADRVARAAREGDVLGIGGQLVSDEERRFIERLDQLIQDRRGS
ncbi:MAG: hypothetical protein ACR2I8_10375 [Steroidobacteraceae bacterium]